MNILKVLNPYATVTDVIKWHWRPLASKMSNSRLSKHEQDVSV